MEKIYQHHVPRFYLRAWAINDRLWCLGYGKSFPASLSVVGGEKYFYKLHDLTEEDIALIERFAIAPARVGLQPLHRKFLAAFTFPWAVKKDAHDCGTINTATATLLDEAITNTMEDYHTGIENSFQPYLTSLLAGDASFYAEREKAAEFLYDLCVQYFRTKKIKEAVIAMGPPPFVNVERVWNILSHIFAVTVGASLFADLSKFKIVLIDNPTSIPFITADQPIINLRSEPGNNTTPPTRLEFYYPLSPSKAMSFLEQSSPSGLTTVKMDEAHHYNLLIAAHSFQQIYSNSENYLKALQVMRRTSLSRETA
jgi:hypothetical protein